MRKKPKAMYPVLIHMSMEMLEALDAQADKEGEQAGEPVARITLIRRAINQFLEGLPQEAPNAH